jgi:hypothetical protein
MKRKLWLLALVGAILLSAAPVLADGEFYVVGGGGPPVGTKITSVPYTILTPGFYFLAKNLTYSGTGNAITISVDDVTLDLMGCSLTNAGAKGTTNGVYMGGRSNVEIRNGTVTGFNYGINAEFISSARDQIINVRANKNNYGIFVLGNSHLIKGCNASFNSNTGIWIESGSVLENVAFNNTTHNFALGGLGPPTSLLVDRNSAYGLATNYYNSGGTGTLMVTGTNAGTP